MHDPSVAAPSLCHVHDVALVAVTGADGVDLLHRLCTQNVRPLAAPGAVAEALFVSAQGRLLHHVTAWRPQALADAGAGDNVVLLATVAKGGAALVEHLERYTIVEEVHYAVLGESVPCATLVWAPGTGPSELPKVARALPAGLAPGQAPTLLPASPALGTAAWVVGRVGQNQADFVARQLPAAYTALAGGGAEAWTVSPCSPEAWRYVRLRAGLAALGEDYEVGGMPLEARLGARTVSWNKGCYVGQEVLSRLDSYRKVARLTMGLVAPVQAAPALAEHAGAWRLRSDGKPIGRLTSWALGSGAFPRHPAGPGPHVLGLATVKTAAAHAGTDVVLCRDDDEGKAGPQLAATLVDCVAWS